MHRFFRAEGKQNRQKAHFCLLVGLKPPVSARNTEGLQESQLTGAAETEEQLLGVGHLPKGLFV